ncbi:MAG: hypothetical protein ISR65_09400 [Bacteriovoracaceae bacterium]|nr:hypothetical protein [Bacteriovoracaceae bacterium]
MADLDYENPSICYACGKDLVFEIGYKVSRQEECEFCKIGLHCCKMCEFYDTSVYNECREPLAERILDKERVQFCDYFKIAKKKDTVGHDVLVDKANSLFKD